MATFSNSHDDSVRRRSSTRHRSVERRFKSLGFGSIPTGKKARQSQPARQQFIRLPRNRTVRFRLILVWLILLLLLLGVLINLLRVQILQAPMLREQAKAQQTITINSTTPLRPVVDRTGDVLAIDEPIYTLYAHPMLFQKPKETIANALAKILNQSPEALITRFNQGKSGIRIADRLSEETNHQITALDDDGLELVQEQQRLYPQDDLFANVVGYLNVDRQPQAGVELSESNRLKQHIRAMQVNRSGDGEIEPIDLPDDFLDFQKDDLRLQLTLDSRLQRTARFALKQQLTKYHAKRGTVLVMDVRDGSLLTFVSEPSYNPNQYYKAELDHLRDWVLTDLYEPGSTFKPINLAIALESGAIQSDDTFLDEGAIDVGGWPIQDDDFETVGGRGTVTVTEILQYSSNVGMVHIMQRLQPGVYYGWLQRIGLTQPTGIDLPAETSAQLKTYDQFTTAQIEPATTAFGQGFSLTPVKLLQLDAMIANGGKLVTPHVVHGLTDPTGKLYWQPTFAAPQPLFSADTTQRVLQMMEQVVEKGTGRPARIQGYRIAGKTGTAQKASVDGGYSHARVTSFIGILPAKAPCYAVLAVVDEPQGDDAYGATVSAPIVKTMMEALITLEQISPAENHQ